MPLYLLSDGSAMEYCWRLYLKDINFTKEIQNFGVDRIQQEGETDTFIY